MWKVATEFLRKFLHHWHILLYSYRKLIQLYFTILIFYLTSIDINFQAFFFQPLLTHLYQKEIVIFLQFS